MSGFDAFAATQPQDFRAQDTYSADFTRSDYVAVDATGGGYSYNATSASARVANSPQASSGASSQLASPSPSTRNEQQARGLMSDNQNSRGSDKRKQSLYFPEAMLQEIKDEAARLDRSLSWIVQRA